MGSVLRGGPRARERDPLAATIGSETQGYYLIDSYPIYPRYHVSPSASGLRCPRVQQQQQQHSCAGGVGHGRFSFQYRFLRQQGLIMTVLLQYQ